MADTAEKKEEKPSNNRWWEFYVVRYALGTIFGALIVHMLSKNGLAIPFPSDGITDITKLEGLPLLLGYGLAYCYLASAPILVFHSARFSMQYSGFRWSVIIIVLVSLFTTFLWACYAAGQIRSTVTYMLATLAIAFILFVILLQFQALIYGMNNIQKMWDFYVKLDINRRDTENRGLVESYRHLREHGNAFFVVCLEMLLGLGIYVASKVSVFQPKVLVNSACNSPGETCDETGLLQTIVLLFIWILPAAFVWTIGCFMEREFANGPKPATMPSVTPLPAIPRASGKWSLISLGARVKQYFK